MGLWCIRTYSKPEFPDPVGGQTLALLRDFGINSVTQVRASKLYTIDSPNGISDGSAARVGRSLLSDPVVETFDLLTSQDRVCDPDDRLIVEVHFKPGVMDSVAESTRLALSDMGIQATNVRTGRRYELFPIPTASELRRIPRLLGNPSIEDVVIGARPLTPPPSLPVYGFNLRRIAIRDLDHAGLTRLSESGHLFLSGAEMTAIQRHFAGLGRDPTDLELETVAQTWSEHCVHKTLKSEIVYRGHPMPSPNGQGTTGPTVELRYSNLLRDTIARATAELGAKRLGSECLSVFKDNAGIIAFDDDFGIAFKVETHNHPSAIEPYGGASTGLGGVIRDVLGCGLGAKPIANTDVFCVAPPDWPIDAVPKGVIHPRIVLKGIVAGVRDYGNRMGIPTVNGAVQFDPRYLGNPLVYCGCIGLIPRNRIEKAARPGDAIVLMGGRTGRDGIHGATFSSAELTESHEDEFAHAVQIGNAIEEKKVLDVVLQAREFGPAGSRRCLFSAITDCGAGGLSSAVGEMAAEIGAEVDLENVPLKYAGLRYDEIWISEAQERMVLAVPPENADELLKLAASEDVEATVIGRFTDSRRLVVRYQHNVVGDLDLAFLLDGLPRVQRQATWTAPPRATPKKNPATNILDRLKTILGNPNVASKHWIIRQYDHEVGGRSVVKPLVGKHDGPADAAVIRPRLDSKRGIAIGCGLASARNYPDPYWMAVASIDEALRNIVCVGGDPRRTAILDNFCWPRVDNSQHLGALVRACQACYDAAKAYGVPFISGKDSLNNEFALGPKDADMLARLFEDDAGMLRDNRLAIPYTLLISAIALVDDTSRGITSAPRIDDNCSDLFFVGLSPGDRTPISALAKMHQVIADLIRNGRILAAHDCSEGGPLLAAVEMALSGDFAIEYFAGSDPLAEVFSGYVLQTRDAETLSSLAEIESVNVEPIATIRQEPNPKLTVRSGAGAESIDLALLRKAWQQPLDW